MLEQAVKQQVLVNRLNSLCGDSLHIVNGGGNNVRERSFTSSYSSWCENNTGCFSSLERVEQDVLDARLGADCLCVGINDWTVANISRLERCDSNDFKTGTSGQNITQLCNAKLDDRNLGGNWHLVSDSDVVWYITG